MATINEKADWAHKFVKAALLFCFNLKSRRLVVLTDSSTNGDIIPSIYSKDKLSVSKLHRVPPPIPPRLKDKNNPHTMHTILVTKNLRYAGLKHTIVLS